MAAQHIRAARKAVAFERLEAVRARVCALFQLSDSPLSDIPTAVARDAELFQIAQVENIAAFLEGVSARAEADLAEGADSEAQIADLQRQIAEKDAKIVSLSATPVPIATVPATPKSK